MADFAPVVNNMTEEEVEECRASCFILALFLNINNDVRRPDFKIMRAQYVILKFVIFLGERPWNPVEQELINDFFLAIQILMERLLEILGMN